MRGIACFAGERGLCPLYVVQRRPRRHSDKFFDPLFFNAAALNDNLIRDAHPFRGKVGACEVCRTIVVPCGHAPRPPTPRGRVSGRRAAPGALKPSFNRRQKSWHSEPCFMRVLCGAYGAAVISFLTHFFSMRQL